MKALWITACLFLAGCVSVPKTAWLDPDAPVVMPDASLVAVNFRFDDQRPNSVALHYPDGSQVSTDPEFPLRLQQRLAQGLEARGYAISNDANAQLTVSLQSVQANIGHGLVRHTSDLTVVTKVIARRGNHTLTRRFTTAGKLTAPLKADAGRIESEMNRLLEKNMLAILTDSQLSRFFNVTTGEKE